jgi:hypothetical protein
MNQLVESPEILETPELPGEVQATLPPVVVRTLDKFGADPAETIAKTLFGIRWLCRAGSLLLVGPTGIGKSSFALQFGTMAALGRPFFGIAAASKLKVLIFQAENDDADIGEMRDGIFRGLALSPEEQAEACRNIIVICESVATGPAFVALVARVVAEHKPDLIIIDPLFAYLGDSVTEQKAVSVFLRNGLNPILQEHGCGLVLIHHTNKPKAGREKPDWQAGDMAYLGAGTAELANWSRAVMAIRSIGSHSVFMVELGKRGRRAGLVDEEGKPAYSFPIKHAERGIHWEPAGEDDLPAADESSKASVKVADVLSVFGKRDLLSYTHLVEAITENYAVGARTAKRAIARALGDSAIRKTGSGLYERIKPKGDK